jgi:hypothetical protein
LTSGDSDEYPYHEPWNDDSDTWFDVHQSVLETSYLFFDLYLSYPKYVLTPMIWTSIGINLLLPLYSLDSDFLEFLASNEHYTTDTD